MFPIAEGSHSVQSLPAYLERAIAIPDAIRAFWSRGWNSKRSKLKKPIQTNRKKYESVGYLRHRLGR